MHNKLNEDNSGFVIFPSDNNLYLKTDSGKTLVYIVAFEVDQNKSSEISSVNLFQPGDFVADDVLFRPKYDVDKNVIHKNKEQDFYDSLYFPHLTSNNSIKKLMSINLISCICVGWCDWTYEYKNEIKFWNATFNDLTHEGRKLYYSLRKLHNNKEVRILTFNSI
jgi:hypothetical protein